MFYKKEENGNWLAGSLIYLPNGILLSVDNKDNEFGWNWFDEEPEEYTEWLNEMMK